MVDIKKILWPVDISYMDLNTNIIPYVNSLCLKYDADLHLVFVLNFSEQSLMLCANYIDVDMLCNNEIKEADEILSKFVKENISKDITAHTVSLVGQPVRAILEYADDKAIDLIIMGTQGRSRFEEFILGSVSKQIVKRAKAPVLTISPHINL